MIVNITTISSHIECVHNNNNNAVFVVCGQANGPARGPRARAGSNESGQFLSRIMGYNGSHLGLLTYLMDPLQDMHHTDKQIKHIMACKC